MKKIAGSEDLFPLRVVSDLGDRGGVVEMPVCRASVVKLKHTSGGGVGKLDITISMLEEMANNFFAKPGPVPVYFGHEDIAPRKPDTPASGWVIASWVEGDVLWNRINLGPKAFDLIVRQRGFAGASIEAEKDKTTPTMEIEGWVETGLSITNRPALDIQYLAASEANPKDRVVIVSQLFAFEASNDPKQKENQMPPTEFSLEDKTKMESKIGALELELAEANKDKAKLATLEAEVVELKKRPTPEKLMALEASIALMQDEQTKDRVTQIVTQSVAAGKPPAFFEGALKDPLTFLKTRFSGSLDMLRASADALPVVAKMTTTSTQSGGPKLGDGSRPKDLLFAEARKAMGTLKTSFDEALQHVKETNPDLYASGMEDYKNTPLPGAALEVSE